jgi:L-lactate dehydrogenase complex protein LldE
MTTSREMKVALFIPCFIDRFYPNVAVATLQLLEKLGCDADYPMQQTCCGQPMANAGCEQEAIPTYLHFIDTFKDYDYIVAPSGSCIYHVKHHYDVIEQTESVTHVRGRVLELSEFLLDVLKVKSLKARFPYKVGLHQGCHGLRGLRLGKSTEQMTPSFSKINTLLDMVDDLELVELDKKDECCGFGGTFAVTQAAVSAKMGRDRVADHVRNGAEIIVSGDMSCLMHIEGVIKRKEGKVGTMHYVEVLNSGE